MKKFHTPFVCFGLVFGQFFEKDKTFTKQDTLKGSNTNSETFGMSKNMIFRRT
jgi:hypothetical protein